MGESVQAGAENHVLTDAVGGAVHDQVLDETGTGYDGCSEGACGMWVHVGPAMPSLVGGRETEADLVFKNVRRRIELHMQRSPQSDSHSRAVWPNISAVHHCIAMSSISRGCGMHSASRPRE